MAISQQLLVPQKSMTYQTVLEFHEECISWLHEMFYSIEDPLKKRKKIYFHNVKRINLQCYRPSSCAQIGTIPAISM